MAMLELDSTATPVTEDEHLWPRLRSLAARLIVSWPARMIRRIVQAVLTMIGASVFVWILFSVAPGDPAQRALAARGILAPTMGQLADMRHSLGLDQPLPSQFWTWITSAFHGDLGHSYISQAPVITEVTARLGPTLRLATVGMLVVTALALCIGLAAAAFAGKWPDVAARFVLVLCATTPAFVSGLLIVQFVIVNLRIGHALGNGGWGDAILPGLCLGLAAVAVPARVLRESLIEALDSQFALVATARGARMPYVLVRHGLPNAAIPFVHALALTAAWLIGGAVIVEAVFNWPGLGSYLVQAVENRDIPVVQAITLLATASFILASLCADLVSGHLESRVGEPR